MWAYAVRASRRPISQASSLPAAAASAALNYVVDSGDVIRMFSSSDDGGSGDGKKGGGDGSDGKGGNRGENKRSQGGGGRNNRNPNDGGERRSPNQQKGRRPKKESFSEKFFEPAARGELKKHQSGIPKLAGRRPKGHGVRGAVPSGRKNDPVDDLIDLQDELDTTTIDVTHQATQSSDSPGGGSAQVEPRIEDTAEFKELAKIYSQLVTSVDPELYYWDERTYDNVNQEKKMKMLDKLMEEATTDADGNLVVEVDDDVYNMFDEAEEEEKKPTDTREPKREGFAGDDVEFVMEKLGLKLFDEPPDPKTYDKIKPLQLEGPDASDFIMSMMKHPTKFAEYEFVQEHEESTREPVPDYPPHRRNPPVEFVERYLRFLYVWGLPPLTVDGKPGDVKDPTHCFQIQKTVAELYDISTEQVSVASHTSAFVGFANVADHRFASYLGPMVDEIESPVVLSKYQPGGESAASKPSSSILLQNLSSEWTPSLLAKNLFPEGTDVGDAYGKNLKPQDVRMLTQNSAVLRLESAEMADSALASTLVQDRLLEIGRHRVRSAKARRELVFTGTHGRRGFRERLRTLGPRLIVDGDMPTKEFYVSHADVLFLRNLDPLVTKEDIAKFFQPYCSGPRDVDGSVEFVTCREGSSTGRAYVGFDELGEAQAALESLASSSSSSTGVVTGLGSQPIAMKLVKDLTNIVREKRQTRTEEELLDDLNNWERFVDPDDLQLLYDHNISKESLDETFRSIRFSNRTFSTLDQALRSETVNPEKEVGGMYREFVQSYIETLKDCLATPDNPGHIFESLFFPGEEYDTEIFDREPQRQAELKRRREYPPSD